MSFTASSPIHKYQSSVSLRHRRIDMVWLVPDRFVPFVLSSLVVFVPSRRDLCTGISRSSDVIDVTNVDLALFDTASE